MSWDGDEEAIRKSLQCHWEGDDLCILPYPPKRSGRNNGVTEFILDFKAGNPQAVTLGTALLVEAVESFARAFQEAKCGYILAAPPHGVGKAHASSEAACKSMADALRVRHLFGALKRTEFVQKAAFAPPGERPGYFDHLRTIQYDGPDLKLQGKGVILFDDVLTRGDTSMACAKIITDATDCSKVLGVFLGRTPR
jgi:hypothetical protein